MRIINSIFKTFVLSLLLISQVHFAYSQSAALLPNASQVFLDNNGKPLSSGTVNFYIPGTLTPKMVWQDANQTVPWTQPITLNAAGRPPGDKGIYGNGTYRQIVKAQNTNQIWDQPTAAVGSAGAGVAVGDGNSVGTILTWGGMVAPNQYQFAYGQTLARSSFPELLAATTLLTNLTCVGGNVTITNLADTSNIPIGAPVEANCIPSGAVVVSKTLTTVDISIPASISNSTTGRFFPYGNGNGSTTFTVVDMRGKVAPGRTNMGGVVASNLTSAYYGSSPDAVGANGGEQSQFLATINLPPYTPVGTIAITPNPHSHTYSQAVSVYTWQPAGSAAYSASTTSSTSSTSLSAAFTGTAQGGTSTAFAIIPPSITLNYIIKVTPDTSISGLFGVASIGGMQGVITCGTGLVCVGNNISVVVGGAGGSNTQVQYNNAGGFAGSSCFIWVSPALTVGGTGCTGQFKLGGTTSGFLTQTVGSIAGTPIITWGNTSGTPAVTASAPLSLNTTTGNLTITGSALTKTDDTNVTITLGGTPTTALLAATSLTLGWTGTLAAARLNSNVVQAIVNDTNVTGSISAQSLTLGWTGTLALTRGGTGQSTALAARASTGLNIDSATSTGDANYTILPTDRLVYHTALSAARTDTLPAANSVNIGQVFYINDFRGVASASNTITLQRAGSDTINGVTSVVAINAQYGAGLFWSDGVSRWTYLPAGSGGGGSGTVTQISTAAPLTGGTITSSGTIGINATITPQGRLTLSSGVPVMTSTVSGATAHYYTPYNGNLVPIYDGTTFTPTAFAEVSQATTDTTKSPSAVGASSIYDIFCWIDTGPTNRCTRGPAWTNSTTRSAGTVLTRVNGVYLNNASITNGPAASRGTYVGTIASNASSTIDYIFGAAGSTPVMSVLNVWNAYNRVSTSTFTSDTTSSWTYALTAIRAANAQTTYRHNYLLGLAEDFIEAKYSISFAGQTGVVRAVAGICYDVTNAYATGSTGSVSEATTAAAANAIFVKSEIGTHFVSACENTGTTVTVTYYGILSNAASGLFLNIRN